MKIHAQQRLAQMMGIQIAESQPWLSEANANDFHGHVVARPDGMRARCGSAALGCTICAREEQLLASGEHPGAPDMLTGSEDEKYELNLKITCTDKDTYLSMVNMLGVIQWNCNVGHSAVTAAFFDGDGSTGLAIEGLPESHATEMATALSDFGDGMMGMVGPSNAIAYNDGPDNTYRRKTVWPPEKEEAAPHDNESTENQE